MNTEHDNRIVVSPFEYAIRQIAEPETLHLYREETEQEKADRIRADFKRVIDNIKTAP